MRAAARNPWCSMTPTWADVAGTYWSPANLVLKMILIVCGQMGPKDWSQAVSECSYRACPDGRIWLVAWSCYRTGPNHRKIAPKRYFLLRGLSLVEHSWTAPLAVWRSIPAHEGGQLSFGWSLPGQEWAGKGLCTCPWSLLLGAVLPGLLLQWSSMACLIRASVIQTAVLFKHFLKIKEH